MSRIVRLRALLSGADTLGARAARAGVWSVLDLGVGNVLRLASNLVMTRLLVPEAFGLMAMVATFHVALVMFTDLGIEQSVVRSARGDSPRFLRVAWTAQIVRSLAIAAVIVLGAGALALAAPALAPAGTVYADRTLPALIAVSALTIVLKGLESTNMWLAGRRLELGKRTLVTLSGQIVGILAMVAFAAINPTVWALLLGGMLGTAFTTGLTHVAFAGPRMARVWDREIADELWTFGRHILVSSALGFVANNADRLILGALLDLRSFGFYVIALTWVQVFVNLIEKLTGQIGMPVLSEVARERPERIRPVFRKFSLVIDAICLASFGLCLFGGPVLIALLYRPEYAAAGALMPLLAVMVLARRFVPLVMLLLSHGDSRALMQVTALRALAICVALPLGYHAFGIAEALLASALTQLAGAPLLIRRTRQFLGESVRIDGVWALAILAVSAALYAAYAPL